MSGRSHLTGPSKPTIGSDDMFAERADPSHGKLATMVGSGGPHRSVGVATLVAWESLSGAGLDLHKASIFVNLAEAGLGGSRIELRS